MKRLALAVVAAALLAAVAACSGATAPPAVNVPLATPTPAVPTSTAPPGVQLNERGNIVKQIGETGGWGGAQGGATTVSFVVDKITVDPQCSSRFASKPDNGHFLRLDIRLETTPQLGASEAIALNPGFFSTIGTDGITESNVSSGASYSCLDDKDQLPSQLTPASKYRGSLVLDTRNPSGILMLRPPFFAQGGGWEWTYGAPA